MITAIAIDDEPLSLKVISAYCASISEISLLHTYQSHAEAERFLRKRPVDLIFLDINMPSGNGVDFYRNLVSKPLVIFTTAFAEYAVHAFEVEAIDYLVKPISPERFALAVQKVINTKNGVSGESIFVRADSKTVRVNVAEILFIESLGDYLKINLTNNRKLVTRMTLKNILSYLQPDQFMQVHRSFIVQTKFIRSVSSRMIEIEDQRIPVGESFKETVMDKLGR
ncbi:MAG: response regulator transcription factor [Bacteroidetes bacterium]|nr:response regulator transcription factor [Bacteroidota bacterium]